MDVFLCVSNGGWDEMDGEEEIWVVYSARLVAIDSLYNLDVLATGYLKIQAVFQNKFLNLKGFGVKEPKVEHYPNVQQEKPT